MLDNELKIPAVSHVQKKRKDIGNDNIVYLFIAHFLGKCGLKIQYYCAFA